MVIHYSSMQDAVQWIGEICNEKAYKNGGYDVITYTLEDGVISDILDESGVVWYKATYENTKASTGVI